MQCAVGTIGIAGGAISGASGGFAGGFVGGAGNAWAGGASFSAGLKSGLVAGGIGATTGGIVGGISGGIRAAELDRNILTGAKKQPITFRINKDGTGSLISGYNYDRKNTSDFVKEYYKTPLDSYPSVSINSNGQVNIKLPKNIDGIDAVRAFNDKGKLMNVENLNPGRKFITFNTPFGKPDYFILHGFRYHSNPVRSFGDLFHSKSGNIRYP